MGKGKGQAPKPRKKGPDRDPSLQRQWHVFTRERLAADDAELLVDMLVGAWFTQLHSNGLTPYQPPSVTWSWHTDEDAEESNQIAGTACSPEWTHGLALVEGWAHR